MEKTTESKLELLAKKLAESPQDDVLARTFWLEFRKEGSSEKKFDWTIYENWDDYARADLILVYGISGYLRRHAEGQVLHGLKPVTRNEMGEIKTVQLYRHDWLQMRRSDAKSSPFIVDMNARWIHDIKKYEQGFYGRLEEASSRLQELYSRGKP